MARALLVSVCLSFLALAGCTVTTSNPADDCRSYVENELCPTAMFCGATYLSINDCIYHFESSGSTVLDCDTVSGEDSGALSACRAQTSNSYCGDIVIGGYVNLPPACSGVFF
jgi:hypothetical protein